LPSLRINDNFDELALRNDADFLFFERFLEQFGYDEILVVAFETEDVLSRESLEFIERLESVLAEVPHVAKTMSLASAQDVRSDGDTIEIVKLIEKFPETRQERDALEQRIRTNPLYAGLLASEDFRVGAIHLKIDESISNRKAREDLIDGLEEILQKESERTGRSLYMAGSPPVAAYVTKQTFRDVLTYLPFTFVLVVGSMFLVFRNYYLTVIPFVAVLVSVIWTLALLTLLTGEINLVTILIPTTIFVVGTSDCVHILANYQDSVYKAESRREAIVRTVRLSAIPCLLTSLTTMVGFGSMVINDIIPIKQLGVFSAVGIAFAYLFGITLIPILLSYLRHLHLMEFKTKENPIPGRLKPVLRKLAEIGMGRSRIVLAASAVLLLLTYAGVRQLYVDTDPANWFGRESALKKSLNWVNGNIAGSGVFYISIEMADGHSVTEQSVLRSIQELETSLEAMPHVGRVLTIADVIKYLNFKFNNEEQGSFAIPEEKGAVVQLLLLASLSDEEGFLEEFVGADLRSTVLTAIFDSSNLAFLTPIVEQTRGYLERAFPSANEVHVTGRAILLTNLHGPLIEGLRKSLLLAALLIFLLVALAFRSVKIGLMSMVPNFLPVAFTFGVMGLVGLPLNLFTTPFACIALGVAVDDTMHFLARLRIEFRREGEYRQAILNTMESVGKALIYTSIIFIAGFMIFLISGFQVTRNFGALVGFTVFGALIADLLLLPVLVVIFKPFGKERSEEP
jgi:predicted RND superfamily exporter protein